MQIYNLSYLRRLKEEKFKVSLGTEWVQASLSEAMPLNTKQKRVGVVQDGDLIWHTQTLDLILNTIRTERKMTFFTTFIETTEALKKILINFNVSKHKIPV